MAFRRMSRRENRKTKKKLKNHKNTKTYVNKKTIRKYIETNRKKIPIKRVDIKLKYFFLNVYQLDCTNNHG